MKNIYLNITALTISALFTPLLTTPASASSFSDSTEQVHQDSLLHELDTDILQEVVQIKNVDLEREPFSPTYIDDGIFQDLRDGRVETPITDTGTLWLGKPFKKTVKPSKNRELFRTNGKRYSPEKLKGAIGIRTRF